MGTWGTEPWDNDIAADWFHILFRSIPDTVIEGLRDSSSDIQLAVETADRILAGHNGYLKKWEEDEPLQRHRLQAMRDELASRLINLRS